MMDRTRFLVLLDIYGAQIDKWPSEVRVSARLFLESADQDVLSRMEDERDFDDFLAPASGPADVSVGLEERLIALAPSPSDVRRSTRRLGWISWTTPRWASAMIVGGCLIGGAGAGYAATSAETHDLAAADMLYFAASADTDVLDVIGEGEAE